MLVAYTSETDVKVITERPNRSVILVDAITPRDCVETVLKGEILMTRTRPTAP